MLRTSSRLAYVKPKLASQRLVGTLVALAFLLQAMSTLPLAVRMAAETPRWAQNGSAMSHTDHQRPATPQPPHPHDQCPICYGSPVSFGALATALIFLVVTLLIAPLVERANCNSLPHPHPGSRFGTYRSRAPPVSA